MTGENSSSLNLNGIVHAETGFNIHHNSQGTTLPQTIMPQMSQRLHTYPNSGKASYPNNGRDINSFGDLPMILT